MTNKRLFMTSIPLNFLIHPAIILFYTAIDINVSNEKTHTFRMLIFILAGLGILSTLFFVKNFKYYYQVQYLQISTCSLVAGMYFSNAIWFMLPNELSTNIWIILGVVISLVVIIRDLLNQPLQWEVVRQEGKLKKYLDEENWTYKFELSNTVENIFLEKDEKGRRKKWFSRLEKLHYIMPAIGVALSRAFSDQDISLLTILVFFIGLIFASQIKIPLYKKFRSWEKEKGRLLLLHESWNK